jgi:hypothetical protein
MNLGGVNWFFLSLQKISPEVRLKKGGLKKIDGALNRLAATAR